MSELTAEDFTPGNRVIYVPNHANGDTSHEDCERGAVFSTNDKYVFVKFNDQVAVLGWEDAGAPACLPDNLVKE